MWFYSNHNKSLFLMKLDFFKKKFLKVGMFSKRRKCQEFKATTGKLGRALKDNRAEGDTLLSC